jgi:hypothetical protein
MSEDAKTSREVALGVESIRAYIGATSEASFVDAKRACSWNDNDTKASLARDIAGLANSKGGGALVIGKREVDGRIELESLNDEQRTSFEVTKVAKWINNHFKPSIQLTCHPIEHDGHELLVIKVDEFLQTPVMCIKGYQRDDGKHILEVGAIYVRTDDVETAKLLSPEQFRELVRRAAIKHQEEMREMFSQVLSGKLAANTPTDKEQFALSAKQVATDLTEGQCSGTEFSGWILMLHPGTFEKRWIGFNALSDVLERININSVRFPRQFPFPLASDWGARDEWQGQWGITEEGLYIYATPFEEDHSKWVKPPDYQDRLADGEIPAGQWLNAVNSVWLVRRFYLLAANYSKFFEPSENMSITISATNIRNRWLMFNNEWLDRASLRGGPTNSRSFNHSIEIHAGELASDWSSLSLDCVESLVRRFEVHHQLTKVDLLNMIGRYGRIGL